MARREGGAPGDSHTWVPRATTESLLDRAGCRAEALLSAPSFQRTPQLLGCQSWKRPLEISWSSSVIYKREDRDPGGRCDRGGAAPPWEPWCPAPGAAFLPLPFTGVCVSPYEGICLLPLPPILSPIIFPRLFVSFPDHLPPDPPRARVLQPGLSSRFCS